MPNKVLVAFAMKEEFAPWRRRHRFDPVEAAPYPVEMARMGGTEVYVALAGAGAPQTRYFQALTAHLAPAMGIVTGVAAGLKPQWRPGDVLAAQCVSSADGLDKISSASSLIDIALQCGAKPAPLLITVPHIIRTIEEKVRLGSLGDAADMESLPLMNHWSNCGIPSLALRVILDPVEMPMTCDFESAMDAQGQVRIAKILGQLIRHPQLVPGFVHLGRQSSRVLTVLAQFLDRLFKHLDRNTSSQSSQ